MQTVSFHDKDTLTSLQQKFSPSQRMSIKGALERTSLAKYRDALRSAPREVIYSPVLLSAAFIYASGAIPLSTYTVCQST